MKLHFRWKTDAGKDNKVSYRFLVSSINLLLIVKKNIDAILLTLYLLLIIVIWIRLRILGYYISCLFDYIREFKGKLISVRLSEANENVKFVPAAYIVSNFR